MSTPAAISGPERILRRPHFRLAGAELYFLISRRPLVRLSASELAVWAALEGEPTVAELRQRFPEEADRALDRFLGLGLCERAEATFPGGRRRVLVIEPHSDDAVLSLGGTMWLRRHDCEFHIVTLAGRSNFTSYYDLDREFFGVAQVVAIRDAEATLFARLLGGRYRSIGLPDAPLRYRDDDWSLDWYRRHRGSVAAFIAHQSGAGELRAWTEAVRDVLRDFRGDEVWIPLGGPHTDHDLARSACLQALREDPTPLEKGVVRFYQEVPYAARYPAYTANVVDALTRRGAGLEPEVVPVASVFAEKLRLVSLYGSQFKLEALREDIEASARLAAGDGGLAERLWRLERLPGPFEPWAFAAAGDPAVGRAASRLGPWVRRHGRADRIRLLLLVPAGRWAEDLDELLRAFPEARFEAYVAPAAAAEVAALDSPRVEVHHVGAGARAWARLALRLALKRPRPTLFLAGNRRLRAARGLAALWPGSDPVVLPSMNHLMLALRQLAAAAEPPRAPAVAGR